MDLELIDATVDQQDILENLLELYQHDFTDFDPDNDVDDRGRFGFDALPRYWREPDRHALLLRADGRWAGFALVARRPGRIAAGDVWWMAEFFVMRKYRRRGIGTEAARRVFARFPGRWEVAQLATNLPAQAFWRGVIGGVTAGQFTERRLDDERWRGPVQAFVSRARP